MFDYGTVINGTLVEDIKSFQVLVLLLLKLLQLIASDKGLADNQLIFQTFGKINENFPL